MVEAVRRARRAAEDYERRSQEEERRRRASAQRAAEEQVRVEDLARRAAAWRQADEMAAFIAEVEFAAHDQKKLFAPGSPHARWLSWAHEHVVALRQSTFREFPAAPLLAARATAPQEEKTLPEEALGTPEP
jgi:hypothetical protein